MASGRSKSTVCGYCSDVRALTDVGVQLCNAALPRAAARLAWAVDAQCTNCTGVPHISHQLLWGNIGTADRAAQRNALALVALDTLLAERVAAWNAEVCVALDVETNRADQVFIQRRSVFNIVAGVPLLAQALLTFVPVGRLVVGGPVRRKFSVEQFKKVLAHQNALSVAKGTHSKLRATTSSERNLRRWHGGNIALELLPAGR